MPFVCSRNPELLVRVNLERVLGLQFPSRHSKGKGKSAQAGVGGEEEEEEMKAECAICYCYALAGATRAAARGAGGGAVLGGRSDAMGTRVGVSFADAGISAPDSIPDQLCANPKCSRVFHSSCLVDWLQSLPSSRTSFGTLFGCCPYCNDPISVKTLK